MKIKFLIVSLIILLLLNGCQKVDSATQEQEPPPVPDQEEPSPQPAEMEQEEIEPILPKSELFDYAWDDRSIFSENLISDAQGLVDALPGASLYRMELNIPDAMDVVTGKQEVLYTNQEDMALEEVYFRLFPNVNGGSAKVENMRVNGEKADFIYESGDSSVKVMLNEPLQPGQKLLFQLDFELGIPREMGGNFGLFGYFENVLVLDLFYPTIPVFDHNGWYNQVPPPNGDPSYYDTSYYLVRVIASEEQTLVASGVDVDRIVEGGVQTVVYANGPARDFSLTASKNFTVISEKVGEVQVNSYTIPGYESAQEWALEVGLGSIKVFNERIGPYEYTEFDIVPTPMLPGGVEYPGMTWINMDYYDLGETFFGLPASAMLESTVSHEIGHHWFYNVVGSSQVSEAWLDESLVQYITGLYFKDSYGMGAYIKQKTGWRFRIEKMEDPEVPIGLPSDVYEGYGYVGAVYGRGPYFFEELNFSVGDEAFSAFLKGYFEKYHWGIATGDGLKQTVEENCQCDLTKLFEEWVYP